jgi:hypothetical protein
MRKIALMAVLSLVDLAVQDVRQKEDCITYLQISRPFSVAKYPNFQVLFKEIIHRYVYNMNPT